MDRQLKDSEVNWIGEIPVNWNLIKVKRKFRTYKEVARENSEKYERLALTLNGVIKRSKEDNKGLQPEKFDGYQILRQGELIFKLIDLENVRTSRVGFSPYEGIVSPAYIKLNNQVESKYGYYFFLSMWHHEVFNGLGGDGVRSNLNSTDLLNLPYLEVPDEEKQRITNFLGQKTAHIDAIIADTKQSILEIRKYKRSLITETVLKGVNSKVEMKNSGIEWIGEIPGNWHIAKTKYIFFIKKNIANEEGHNILSVTQQGLKIKDISKNEGQMAADYSKYQLVNVGDFVMNHMDLLTGWVDESKFEGVTSPDYRVFRFINNLDYSSEYYRYIFQMCYFNKIYYGLGQGISNLGRWRLQTDKFMNFVLPIPPLLEQHNIVLALNEKCAQIDSLIKQKQQLLIELETYKKSLIYEYVTGKKEVL